MSKKGKRIENKKTDTGGAPDKAAETPKASAEKKPFILSRLSRFWRFALISGLATTAVILVLLVIWDNMYGMVEEGTGAYTPPSLVYDHPDEGEGKEGEGVAIPNNPAATPRPTPQGIQVRDDIYTFLLAGRRDGLTDTLMVATMDMTAQTIEVLSIPRDTVIQNAARSVKKINGAYNSGGGKEDGMNLLLNEIDSIVGFMPKNYISVDMKGFVRLVDAVGPIRFHVPMTLSLRSEGIYLTEGWHDLKGDQALQLVRFRGYGGNNKAGVQNDDYGRMQMQGMFLKEVAKKMLKLENVPKIPEFADILDKNVLSNMSIPKMVALADCVFTIPADNISFHTLPTYSVSKPKEIKGTAYEVIKRDEALKLINETINPFNMDITSDMVEYMSLSE